MKAIHLSDRIKQKILKNYILYNNTDLIKKAMKLLSWSDALPQTDDS